MLRASIVLPAIVASLLLLVPAHSAQSGADFDGALYLTDDAVSINGRTGLLLSPVEPGEATEQTLSVVPVAGPTSITWYTGAPWLVDLEVDPVDVRIVVSSAVEVLGTVVVRLESIDPDGGATLIGEASEDLLFDVAGRTIELTVTPQNSVLPAGDVLALTVTIAGVAELAVNIQYNDGDSAITSLPISVLDSDGDGFGDTQERLAGTDPFDASDVPGGSLPPDDGGGDGDDSDDITEPLVAGGLLAGTLGVAAYALLGRFAA